MIEITTSLYVIRDLQAGKSQHIRISKRLHLKARDVVRLRASGTEKGKPVEASIVLEVEFVSWAKPDAAKAEIARVKIIKEEME